MTDNTKLTSELSKRNSEIAFGYNFNESRMKKCLNIMDRIPPGEFLDLGATQGGLIERMMGGGWIACGVDINPENVAACTAKGLDVRLCDLSVDALPFENERFELIFAGEIIEHLVDTDKFLQDLARCLKPNGSLIITTPNLASFENRMRLIFGIYPEWVDWCTTEGVGHVRAYTVKILKRQLVMHGFDILTVLGSFVPYLPRAIMSKYRLPEFGFTGYLFSNLSECMVIHAKKLLIKDLAN